jgi:cell division control protein 45
MLSVICINVGGMVNLMDFFDISANPRAKWWVIDGHRPLNLFNLFSSSQIIVIDDGNCF